MSWNYRVVKCVDVSGNEYLEIKEAYYNKSGKVRALGEAGALYGDTKKEIRELLMHMLSALDKEIINDM